MCVCALAMANILIDIFGCFPIQNYYFNSLFSAVVLKPLNSSPVSFLLNLISKSWITCFCCYNTDCVVNFFCYLQCLFVCLFFLFIYLMFLLFYFVNKQIFICNAFKPKKKNQKLKKNFFFLFSLLSLSVE